MLTFTIRRLVLAVPTLLFISLMIFLLLFAIVGMSVQEFAASLTGAPLYSWLAAIIAGGAVLPITSVLVRPLAHILPQDETSAVGIDTLVGRRADISKPRRVHPMEHGGRAFRIPPFGR